jgi:hypothetical protein
MLRPMKILTPVIAIALVLAGAPAVAEVKPASSTSFLSAHKAEVAATPAELWKRLIAPKDWWNPDHSWSGTVSGFYIDAQAGGCFCELFQTKDDKGKLQTAGSVEHMRVIYADPGKVLRMQGALGPLQSEAVLGTLTVAIEGLPGDKGSKISFNYMVGGHTRFPVDQIANAVDRMLAEQFARLLKPFGRADATTVRPADNDVGAKPATEAPNDDGLKFDLKDIEQKAAAEKAPVSGGEEQPKEGDPQA